MMEQLKPSGMAQVAIPRQNRELSKYLIIAFYLVTILVVVLYSLNQQNTIRNGGSSVLYRDLMECPAYIKQGFDPADIQKLPPEILNAGTAENAGEWMRFQSPPLAVMRSSLSGLPKRTFFSPWGKEAEEYTIIINIEINNAAMAFLGNNHSVLPGFFFSRIGENWEIFVNGNLVKSEMHLDETGQITSRRTWRDVYFPASSSFFVPGNNVIALRIVGDPAYLATGFSYSSFYYLDEYHIIEKRQRNFLFFAFCGIFGFAGVYHLALFLSIRRKREVFNLYFSIFSFLLCVYSIVRNGLLYPFIPNSDISYRLEYGSLILLLPMFCMFIETLGREKLTKITVGYFVFCVYLSVSQIFFCPQYSEEVIRVWDVSVLLYYSYVFFYDIVYFYLLDKNRKQRNITGEVSGTPIVNILVGTILILICGFYDVLDVLFFQKSFNLFLYSTFVVQIGMSFSLSKRFSGMYTQLEQSNAVLEMAVQKRTMELKEQTNIAVQASQAKSKFLATISHEIRTPLNAVIGLSEIELRGKLPANSRNNIQQIYQSGSSLLEIINDILDVTKIEAGSFDLVPVEYETAPFIHDTVNLNMVRIGSKPIVFVLEIDGDFPRKLRGDELRVRQILNNILSNAIKYTQEGKVILKTAWENKGKEAVLRFTVKDTGIGIHQEDIKKLYTDYSQLDIRMNRKIEGTGLGLTITRKLVEMMKGSIAVESEYGKGSAFTVTLVQGLEDSTGIGEETAEKLMMFQYVSCGKEKDIVRSWMPYGKVLIVDDMPVNLQVARGLLEPYGLRVDAVLSGWEAIDLIRSEVPHYDLVFMDHMMPGMDGIEAVKVIRAWEAEDPQKNNTQLKSERIPIVALTANALTGNMEMFLSSGFDGFISKPIDIVQLDKALNKWIRDKQSPETLHKAEDEGPPGNMDNLDRSPLPVSPPLPSISGVDVQSGIIMTGGTMEGYCQVLALFRRDVEERLPLLSDFLKGTGETEKSLTAFTTQVHALKSASASVGAAEVSKEAAGLEAAGKAGDLAYIEKNLNDFVEDLAELSREIRIWENSMEEHKKPETKKTPEKKINFKIYFLLYGLVAALKSQNTSTINHIIEEIKKNPLDSEAKKSLKQISGHVLAEEFDKAGEVLDKLLEREGNQ